MGVGKKSVEGHQSSPQAVKSCRRSSGMELIADECFSEVTVRNQTGRVIVQRGFWRKEVNLIVPGVIRA